MRKAIIAGLALCAMVSAYADTFDLYWRTWCFNDSATDLTIDPDDESSGILNNYDVLWQLIHSESGTPAEPDVTAEHFLGAGESLLDERYLSSGNSGVWNMALYSDSDEYTTFDVGKKETVANYYVYQRIYELEPGTTAPVDGTWYYNSPVEDLATWAAWGAGTPTAFYAFGDDDQETGVKPTLQVTGTQSVPEPATMSLLGLGALMLGLRRKLRK